MKLRHDPIPFASATQVLGSDLIGRMSSLGAVANIQPSFVGTDSQWVQDRIEPDVQQTSYCWKVGNRPPIYILQVYTKVRGPRTTGR